MKTDTEINEAIAKACGWTKCDDSHHPEIRNAMMIAPGTRHPKVPPRYTTDLNAMRSAFLTLAPEQRRQFVDELLCLATGVNVGYYRRISWDGVSIMLAADLKLWAVAFLRTLGLWKEDK